MTLSTIIYEYKSTHTILYICNFYKIDVQFSTGMLSLYGILIAISLTMECIYRGREEKLIFYNCTQTFTIL